MPEVKRFVERQLILEESEVLASSVLQRVDRGLSAVDEADDRPDGVIESSSGPSSSFVSQWVARAKSKAADSQRTPMGPTTPRSLQPVSPELQPSAGPKPKKKPPGPPPRTPRSNPPASKHTPPGLAAGVQSALAAIPSRFGNTGAGAGAGSGAGDSTATVSTASSSSSPTVPIVEPAPVLASVRSHRVQPGHKKASPSRFFWPEDDEDEDDAVAGVSNTIAAESSAGNSTGVATSSGPAVFELPSTPRNVASRGPGSVSSVGSIGSVASSTRPKPRTRFFLPLDDDDEEHADSVATTSAALSTADDAKSGPSSASDAAAPAASSAAREADRRHRPLTPHEQPPAASAGGSSTRRPARFKLQVSDNNKTPSLVQAGPKQGFSLMSPPRAAMPAARSPRVTSLSPDQATKVTPKVRMFRASAVGFSDAHTKLWSLPSFTQMKRRESLRGAPLTAEASAKAATMNAERATVIIRKLSMMLSGPIHPEVLLSVGLTSTSVPLPPAMATRRKRPSRFFAVSDPRPQSTGNELLVTPTTPKMLSMTALLALYPHALQWARDVVETSQTVTPLRAKSGPEGAGQMGSTLCGADAKEEKSSYTPLLLGQLLQTFKRCGAAVRLCFCRE